MRIEEYELDLEVDYPAQEFRGTVVIRASEFMGPWSLDAVELEVQRVAVNGADAEFQLDPAGQRLVVPTAATGDVELTVHYSGRVRQEFLSGFYVSRFGERPLLTTMMEPTGCRRLVPCVDSPDQKAVFRLTVTAQEGLAVVSNAELETSVAVDGRRRWTFAPTPRMATYLLYVGVGPFEFKELKSGRVRVIAATSPGNSERARRPLEMAGPVLQAYEEYYGLPYPLSKLHLIGVPDFSTGAMENWGAIAFAEIGLLIDESSTPAVVRWAVETLVHEIAHQWFGNLVTMYSFDDLWLNESFATFVATKMTQRLGLRGDAWAEFLIRTEPGWWGDSLVSTHPVKAELHGAAEMSEIFDEITYYKGANVLRMLEAYIGEEPFRLGVTNYLTRFQYGNARGEDLWHALAESSGQPVENVMGAWIGRPGLPVVRVEPDGDRVRFSQRRFLFQTTETTDPPWPIPLTVVADGARSTRLFDSATTEIAVRDPASVQVNPGRTGFYRVLYDHSSRDAHSARLMEMVPIDRWAFLNDALAFVFSGEYSVDDFLGLVRTAERAHDYPSVLEAGTGLHLLWTVLEGSPPFREAYIRFHRAQLDRLTLHGRPGDSDLDPVVRQYVVGGLVRADSAFAEEMAGRFGEIDSNDSTLRPAISYAFAARRGKEAIEPLFARLTSPKSEDSAESAGRALGGLPDVPSLRVALGRCFGPEVRLPHTAYLVESVAAHPVGRGLAWAWMQANLHDFEKKVEGSDILSRFLNLTIPRVGLGRVAEVRSYFERERFPEAGSAIRKGLEMLGLFSAVAERAGVQFAAPADVG